MRPKLRIGIAGLGRAFQLMLQTLVADHRLVLAAAADPRPEARNRFAADFSARAYATVEEMCADPRWSFTSPES
jgi:phthalate 4,5-cis-dihydrodiol dehydrogenase